METLLIILSYVIVIITFLFIGKSFSKIIKPTPEEIFKSTIDTTKFYNELNPIVKEIYLNFINKDNLKYFQENFCHIYISNLEVKYWSQNDIYNRHFTNIPLDLLKKHNMTIKEINDTLSLADKTVLDYIAKAVIRNNKEFINRLFI